MIKIDAHYYARFSDEGTKLATVAELYPTPQVPGSPYANSPLGPQFSRVAAAYGDFTYIA
ncbi:hypothetical protein BDV93DRAFT_523748 [Ceratobasidium sp. AG-I]|nr:hypothetical protein BDV93DRAFT_523748 [Ceratobasidium sp. AG-I]